jgi:WS/DGAT/MGAT family acyltransferase
MARYNYERLSALDNSFLVLETPTVYMHVSSTQIFKSGPLKRSAGGIDFEAIKQATERILHRIPRYRQTLRGIPGGNHAVWVDDADFNIDYHVRHASLPRPGSDRQLKRLAARIMGQRIDRSRPVWEMWVIEGLEGDRFALINKLHHCMIDGASGVDLSQIMMSPDPHFVPSEGPDYIPRRSPSTRDLLQDDLRRRIGLPFRAVRDLREFARGAEGLRNEIGTRLRAIRDTGSVMYRAPSETPINGPVGPHRRFDWLTVPLADLKALRRAAGCSVNDIVLTIVTGAFREYLQFRRVRPGEVPFRVNAPVSMRRSGEKAQMGNRISSWIFELPVGEAEPLRQLEAIHATTQELKESQQALGVEMMMAIAEFTPALISLGARSATSGSMNTIVTNVPGPQFPLYVLGAEMTDIYAQVPLMRNIGIGIALMSYDGKVCWGLNADYNLVPDLYRFRAALQAAFERLADAAGVKLGSPPV